MSSITGHALVGDWVSALQDRPPPSPNPLVHLPDLTTLPGSAKPSIFSNVSTSPASAALCSTLRCAERVRRRPKRSDVRVNALNKRRESQRPVSDTVLHTL